MTDKTLNLDAIINDAATKTDEKLATKISTLTHLTDEEINQLFPKQHDQEILAKLISIVKSADDDNQKVNRIHDNSEEFVGVMLRLLGKLL